MIKRVIEQIFQGHAADSLRKTLAEVERAASGKLHNESLADYVTRLASLNYDAQKTTKELEMYRDENERHHATSAENGRIDEEPVEDYMVRIWDGMNVAQRFAEDQKEKLEKAQKEWQERDAAQSKSFNRRLDELAEEAIKQKFRADDIQRDLAKSISLANERAQEISKLRGTHADDIARIDKLSAQLAEIEAEATECGRDEGETVPRFMSRMVIDLGDERASSMAMSKAWAESKEDVARERERGTRINSEYEASIANIMAAANKLGRADYESPEAFMNRQAADMESQARQLNLVRQELGDKTQKVLELSRWHEENLEKIKLEELRYSRLLSETTDKLLGNSARIDNLENQLGKIRECARTNGWTNEASLTDFLHIAMAERKAMFEDRAQISQESPEATRNALRNVTADRDRICTELAAIIAEANKSGRCNGDPVQLLKQGQADLDAMIMLETEKANLLARMANLESQLKAANAAALSAEEDAERATFSENESAKLNALVSKLQGELAMARDQAGVAQHECSIWNNAAARAGQTLTKLGKLQDETEAQFIERMHKRELDRAEQLKNAQLAKQRAEWADKESHKRLMDMIRLADSCGRLHGESVENFIARQEQLRVSNMEQRDEARFEVERLSALVASLQAELEDAKRKYGDIMAALGNETPLEFIDRMKRIGAEQKAALEKEIESLRKNLALEIKAHQEARDDLTAAYKAGSNCGMRNDEELPAFINRLLAQISELRTAAHECGMLPDGNLRSFIYRTRRQLIDATEAGDRLQKLATETSAKLDAALATVANQSAAIAEAQRVTDKYTAACKAATKLKDWASTVRHKVLVKIVHDKAMEDYDNIIKELDVEAAQ